jgi:hypothetical protein
MEIRGRIRNGVVVLEGGTVLPEGAAVTVSCDLAPASHKPRKKKSVQLPLVDSDPPGTFELTNQRIAEVLQEEDVRRYSKFFRKPRKS